MTERFSLSPSRKDKERKEGGNWEVRVCCMRENDSSSSSFDEFYNLSWRLLFRISHAVLEMWEIRSPARSQMRIAGP